MEETTKDCGTVIQLEHGAALPSHPGARGTRTCLGHFEVPTDAGQPDENASTGHYETLRTLMHGLTGCDFIARRIAAIIMRVTYGYIVKGEDDPMITVPFEAMDNFGIATEPGMWMVDFVPQRECSHRPPSSLLQLQADG